MAFVCQVTSAEKEAQNSSSVRTSGKPYQAPYARLSSLEVACTANPENGKTPSTRLETETMGVKAQVSGFEDLKLAMIPESLAKVQVKESPKGFKRLLMFAKKNHSSVAGEHSVESDNASVDGSELDGNVTNAASSSEGNMRFFTNFCTCFLKDSIGFCSIRLGIILCIAILRIAMRRQHVVYQQ